MCDICKTVSNINHELMIHAQSVHKDYVKKIWYKDALSNISNYEEYKTWLERPYDIELNMERAHLDEDNSAFRERNTNLAKSQEAYLKVSQVENIIDDRK